MARDEAAGAVWKLLAILIASVAPAGRGISRRPRNRGQGSRIIPTSSGRPDRPHPVAILASDGAACLVARRFPRGVFSARHTAGRNDSGRRMGGPDISPADKFTINPPL